MFVLEPKRGHQDDADHEWEAHEVVRIFGPLRERAKRILSNQRHQQFLTKCHVQAGQAQNDEGDRRQPMHEPLERIKSRHFATGPALRNPDRSQKHIRRKERHERFQGS